MPGLLGSVFESAEAGSVRPAPPITPPTGPPSPVAISPVQDFTPNPTKIVVVGLGGAGNNTLNRLSSIGTAGTDLIAINTDKILLDSIQVERKILAGYEITKGFGTGGSVELGKRAIMEEEVKIRDALSGANLVFLTCGLGGGTGTGGAPLIAQMARDQGALVVGVVTMPFRMEKGRVERAHEGLQELREQLDSIVIIDNNRLLGLKPRVPISYAFSMADEVLAHMVKGISETIMLPSLINLDFADVQAVMSNGGVVMVGFGESDARDRAQRAIHQALSCPLLGNIDYSKAGGVLMQICCGPNVPLSEINLAGELLQNRINRDAQLIMGARIDPNLGDTLRVILLISGARSPYLLGPASNGGVQTNGSPRPHGLGAPFSLNIDYL